MGMRIHTTTKNNITLVVIITTKWRRTVSWEV